MATVWSPAPYITKQEWLLSDGSVVTSPDFETTSSGRRVRVVGTTESAGSKQVHDLIVAAIDKVAADRNTTRLLRIYSQDEEQGARSGAVGIEVDVFKTAAQLHINQDTNNAYGTTTLLWDFEGDGLPIGATVFLVLNQRNNRASVSTKVVWRSTLPADQQSSSPTIAHYDGSNYYLGSLYRHSNEFRAYDILISKNGGLLPGLEIASRDYSGQLRQAVVDLATRAKALDNLDEIQLPDLRDPNNPTFMKFKRKASNYSASVHNELLMLVQTGPLLERIKNSYNDLVGAMSQLGVVLTARPGDNEFAKAAAGDLTVLKVTAQATEDADIFNSDGIDHKHTVAIDLATGSVIVNCSNNHGLDEVSEAWNIAKFKAEVVGEMDVLLEYAKAYKDPKEQARIRKIIKQRTTPDTL